MQVRGTRLRAIYPLETTLGREDFQQRGRYRVACFLHHLSYEQHRLQTHRRHHAR
jgi:hypothetical protein